MCADEAPRAAPAARAREGETGHREPISTVSKVNTGSGTQSKPVGTRSKNTTQHTSIYSTNTIAIFDTNFMLVKWTIQISPCDCAKCAPLMANLLNYPDLFPNLDFRVHVTLWHLNWGWIGLHSTPEKRPG